MKFTQFKSLGLVSVFALSMMSASAATIVVDGISYTTASGNKATVAAPAASAPAYAGDIVIPATVTYEGTTYTVTGVAAKAFKDNKNVTSLTFDRAIEIATLGRGLFQNMEKLERVVLPAKVGKFTQETFKGDSALVEINIPGNTEALKSMDFQGCVSLKKIVFEEGATPITVDVNIWGDTKADQITLEEIVINRELTSTAVGSKDLPWQGHPSIKKVTYADNLTKVPDYYWQNCSGLVDIHLPAALTSIGSQAFLNTGLTEIELPAGVTSIPTSAFAGSKHLTKVVMLGDVTSIGDLAFSKTAVNEINFPNTLTSIGAQAFAGANITGAPVLPAGITRIGAQAFADNAGLQDITLPSALERIGDAPFKGCSSLAQIVLDNANANYKIDAAGALVKADGSVVIAYPAAAPAAAYTTEAVEIAPYAFNCAANLRSVKLPNVKVYGDHAFDAAGITSIEKVGGEGASIGRYVFANCPNLAAIELAYNEIPVGFANNCPSLTTFKNHSESNIVRQDAFKGCTALKEINLGKICVIIEADAFADVDGLNITVGTNNPPSLAEGVFTPESKISATVPASSVANYKAANQWSYLDIKGDENLAVGGLDLGMPDGMYYAGEDGNLHCVYSDGKSDTYDVGGMPHTFQLAQFKNRIYGASAGKGFIYSNTAATDGDGKLFYISQVDKYLFQATVLDNTGNNAYKDPTALYVNGGDLFVSDRNVCLRKIPADGIALSQDFPSFMENNWMGAYNNDFVYGCIKAGFSITSDQDDKGNPEPLYWIGFKYNGNGIFRFKEKHIGTAANPGPETGYKHIFKGATPLFTTFYIDEPNGHIYMYLEAELANAAKEGALKAGVYRFNRADVEANPDPAMMADLNPILIDGAPVKWEGGGVTEHVGISQFTTDEKGEYLYWCYRAPSASDIELDGDAAKGHYKWAEDYDENNPLHKSGIKRIKLGTPGKPDVELMIPGVEGYGLVPVNYAGSTQPETGKNVINVNEKAAFDRIVVADNTFMLTNAAKVNIYAPNGAIVSSANVAADSFQTLDGKGVYVIEAIFADGAKQVAKVIAK